MFIQLFIKIFLYIQTFFYFIYHKIFIFDNMIILDKTNNYIYNYKFLFMLYYHFGWFYDINKNNNHKWICYLNINEKIYCYEINNYCINLFKYLLELYNSDKNNDNNVNNFMLFKINNNVINISKYMKNIEIFKIIDYEKLINNIKEKDENIKINYLSFNNMISKEVNYIDIKNNIINEL